MKARAKSNSTSSPPPTVAARRSSHASSAAATASAHSSPHLPDLILQSTTMEDFELLCKSAITPAYPNQKSSRFSVSSNPAIAAQPAASLGRGATAASTARPSLSSPPSTTATAAATAAKTPAQATPTPPHTAIPIDENFAEANRSALTAQAHAIISEMKFQEDERNSERDRCVQDKFAQAATALKSSASSPGASPPQLQPEKRQSREVTPRRQASVPVDAAPEFSLYLNRTADVSAFVRNLKEQKVVSDDCKETMLTPPPPPPPSQPPPADDDLPFIDESASDGSSPTANLSPLPPPPTNSSLPIRIQDSAIVDSGPPANVEVEMKELSEAEAYPQHQQHPQLNAARQQHPLTAQNPALHASRVDPNTQMQAATMLPTMFSDASNRYYHFASPAHFRLIQAAAVPGETQVTEALQRGGKRRVGGKERRERLAKKNVKEEMLAETMEGHRGNEAVESLLSYIEGTHQTGPAQPVKQGKKPSRAPTEASAGNGQSQSHAKPPKGGKAGRVKGGGKLASTSPASSATPSLDSDEEEEEETAEEGAATKSAYVNLSPPSPQRPRLIDTTDMRLFASDSMVQQLLKATAEPSTPFSLEEQDFKVVETKKKAKKPPPAAQPWKAASTAGTPRTAALAARPQHSKPSSPPPTTASKAASSVSAPLSPSGRSQPSSAMAAEAPAPSSAQDWPLIPKRRQSVDHLPKAASSAAPTPPSSSASSTAGPAREAGAGTSWASVASRPHGQTASLHTSRASSPNRRSASATGPGNASSPDLALISPPPSAEPLSPPLPLSNEAAALLSPPLPPHPEGAETKSWATVAAAQRPTAVVKPQPPQPQEHLPTESESPVAEEEEVEVVEEATAATASLPSSQTPPPDEPTQTGAPETELSSLGGGGSSGGGLVEFAFPTSDSNSSDLSDDGHSGITFGDFHNEIPAPVLPVHNSITTQGLSFGDFGAVPATETPAVDLVDEPKPDSKLPAVARAKKVPVDESDFARELRQQFELSTQSSEVVVVYSGGQILERV